MKKLMFLIMAATLMIVSCKKETTKPDATEEPAPVANPNELSGEKTLEGGEVAGVWKKGAKITVNGSLKIPTGKSLTIEEGVTVMFAAPAIEVLVLGNLYCKGTATNMIKFTVTDSRKPSGDDFPMLWGGILFDKSAKELLLLYTQIEYTGAVTTEESQSVKLGFYKAAAGERLPAINFRNNFDGKVVIMNCTFNNLGEDGLYMEGGNYIIANNKIYTQGKDNGDAINLKAGSVADICFNLIYSPNTNAMKLSNSGERSPQCQPKCYNNTIVNCGWRRPTVKGGGVWLEAGVLAEVYNTLHINCRFGIKKSGADPNCKFDYNYYYGNDQATVNQFQTTEPNVVRGPNDIAGTTAGSNDPLLVNYPLNNGTSNAKFDLTWDFRLKANSPANNAGTTSFNPHFASTGITIDGVTYKSPAPSKTIGAFGTN